MTNKIVLRSVEEFMADYQPTYQPIFPLFIGGKSQAYSEQAGSASFKRVEAVGDIRSKHITPKDTELHQIGAREGSKTFKKYFLGAQFIQSQLQDPRGIEDVVAQVLDENNKLQDDLLLLGEGTSESTMVNNGLYWSNDPNYILKSSYEVQKETDGSHLLDLHAKVMALASDSDQVSGRKLVIFYGDQMRAKYDGLYSASNRSFRAVCEEALGDNFTTMKLPTAVTPASANGFMVVNMDQVKLHYTIVPALKNQGVNEEKMYTWHNFLMGSTMLEVLSSGGIIRQPVTFEA